MLFFFIPAILSLFNINEEAMFSLRATETTQGWEVESGHYQNSLDSGSSDQMTAHILCLRSLLLPRFLSPYVVLPDLEKMK